MSFPKNNLCLIFIDLPTNEFNNSRALFLPLFKNKKYLNKLGIQEEENVYIRLSALPKDLCSLLIDLINLVSDSVYFFLEESSVKDVCPSLEKFNERLKLLKNKRGISKWMTLIRKTEKKDFFEGEEKELMFVVCSILLNYSITELEFKRQFCIR